MFANVGQAVVVWFISIQGNEEPWGIVKHKCGNSWLEANMKQANRADWKRSTTFGSGRGHCAPKASGGMI